MTRESSSSELATVAPTYFDSRLDELRKILPPNTVTAEAVARVIITALNKTPKLRECSEESILGCLMDIGSLGLLPNTPHGFAWIIPYWNSQLRVNQATLQVGFKGFCELAFRTSEVKMIKGDVVRDGDVFEYRKGSNVEEFVSHTKRIGTGRKDAEVVAAWNSIELLSGGVSIEVMDADELAKIRKMASSRNKDQAESPAWKYFADEMYKKSAVKRNLKLLQIGNMDTVRRAIEIDNKASNLLPGIDVPAKSEHRLILKDAPVEGETIVEELPPAEKIAQSSEKVDPATGEFKW